MDRHVQIRPVDGDEDVARVRELIREYGVHLANHPAGPEHFCVSGLEKEMAGLAEVYGAPGCLLLATMDGQPAGCVALKRLDQPANALELKRLWVRPAFRGIGLGRRLMEAAIDRAQAVAAEAIYLDTVPVAMPEAVRLYAEFGFRQVEPYNATRVPGIAFFRLELQRDGKE
jgi:GNAT superfamily N-acetyltransferase